MALRSVEELRTIGPVRIRLLDVTRAAVPMLEPFRISSGEVSHKEATLVCMRNDEGFGWGESSAMPGAFYSADTPDSCAEQVLALAPRLAGAHFENAGALENFLLGQSVSPFVRVAFETAAWEMLARERSISVRELFGLEHTPVRTGLAVGLYATLPELRAALDRYDAKSYSRLKIKIKRGQDLELVRGVREWFGDIPLFVDANADYSRSDIETFLQLDQFGLIMFEQPFARVDIETSAALQRQIQTPICFDEGIESVDDVYAAAALDACRVVNIKLQRVGGYLEGLRIGEACIEKNLPLWMGTMPELGIGSAQALVLATHPANRFPTDVEPSLRWYEGDILKPQLRMQNAMLSLPDGPGIGFEVDPRLVHAYASGAWSFGR